MNKGDRNNSVCAAIPFPRKTDACEDIDAKKGKTDIIIIDIDKKKGLIIYDIDKKKGLIIYDIDKKKVNQTS